MSFIQQFNLLLFKLTRYQVHLIIIWTLLLLIFLNFTSLETVAYCQQETQVENTSITKVENQESNGYFYLNVVLLIVFSVLLGYNMYNHLETLAQHIEQQDLIIAILEEEKVTLLNELGRVNPESVTSLTGIAPTNDGQNVANSFFSLLTSFFFPKQ